MSKLLANALELQSSDGTNFFEILTGGPYELPDARGADLVVPQLTGHYYIAGDREDDKLTVQLTGVVEGQGATQALKQAAFRTAMLALNAIFDETAALFTLKLHPGADPSVPSGHYYQLSQVRFVRRIPSGGTGLFWKYLTLECESIDQPPRWVYH
jgi:hypothetical protein